MLDIFDLPRGAGDEGKKVRGRAQRVVPLRGASRGLLPLLRRATRGRRGWGLPLWLPTRRVTMVASGVGQQMLLSVQSEVGA